MRIRVDRAGLNRRALQEALPVSAPWRREQTTLAGVGSFFKSSTQHGTGFGSRAGPANPGICSPDHLLRTRGSAQLPGPVDVAPGRSRPRSASATNCPNGGSIVPTSDRTVEAIRDCESKAGLSLEPVPKPLEKTGIPDCPGRLPLPGAGNATPKLLASTGVAVRPTGC
jgi:hypothetical protein